MGKYSIIEMTVFTKTIVVTMCFNCIDFPQYGPGPLKVIEYHSQIPMNWCDITQISTQEIENITDRNVSLTK